MAPLVGKDITERVFMPRFAELCTDAHFHVRKVCAANFGDMCSVVGMENTEEYLVSLLQYSEILMKEYVHWNFIGSRVSYKIVFTGVNKVLFCSYALIFFSN